MARLYRQLGRWLCCGWLLLLAACSSVPDPQKIPTADASSQRVYFIYREWHTSILLPADAVQRHSRYLQQQALGQQFIRVGWGDGDYFTGKDKSFGSATRALLASQHSALQILAYAQEPFHQLPPDTWVPLAISDAGLRRLIRYIDNSFTLVDQQPVPLPGYGEGVGSFYLANGRYGLFSNCNTWSGRALQAAGLPVRSRLQLTAQSVFEQAQVISAHQFGRGAPVRVQ